MEAIINMLVGAVIMAATGALYMGITKGLPKLKAWWASTGKSDFGTIKADVASAHDKLAAIEAKVAADLPAIENALAALKARLDKAGIAV